MKYFVIGLCLLAVVIAVEEGVDKKLRIKNHEVAAKTESDESQPATAGGSRKLLEDFEDNEARKEMLPKYAEGGVEPASRELPGIPGRKLLSDPMILVEEWKKRPTDASQQVAGDRKLLGAFQRIETQEDMLHLGSDVDDFSSSIREQAYPSEGDATILNP